jgi:toxin ParE1/3/4
LPEKLRYQVVFTVAARRDIVGILSRSAREFGAAAAFRYEALILQAVRDLQLDPERPGSKGHPGLMAPGARTYHLSFSRKHLPGIKVKSPRHFILYRSLEPGLIEIGRILDESRDLGLHLPEGYRRAGSDKEI